MTDRPGGGPVSEIEAHHSGYDNFLTICDTFGGRFSGTKSETMARDYILNKLGDYGLQDVHLESVDFLLWRRGNARLELRAPTQRSLGCLSLAYSPSTESEGVEADMVFVPRPTRKCFEGMADEIEGRAVLTYMGPGVGPACQSTHWAEAFGAEALILMANSFRSLQPAGACRWNQPASLPVISVSREDGEHMVRLMNRHGGVTMRCFAENRMEKGRSWNVVGEIPGQNPHEQVILGAHYDGFDIAQSAIDNASGTAVLMEVARVLAADRGSLGRTLRFVWFAAEELGMIGSTAYVDRHRDEMDGVVTMMTTDWPGSPATCGVQRPFSDLSDHLEASLKGVVPRVSKGLGMYSDHFPFMLKGIPSMWIGGSITDRDMETYHTVFDTADKVPPRVLEDSGRLMARIAIDLANARKHPSRHRTEAEIKRFLEDEGKSEELGAEGRWKGDWS